MLQARKDVIIGLEIIPKPGGIRKCVVNPFLHTVYLDVSKYTDHMGGMSPGTQRFSAARRN